MRCPACFNLETKVLDSRVLTEGGAIRRRRECLKCAFRFSTYEEMEILDLMVIKRDGHREPYNKDKLIIGLKKAFEKRPISQDDFKKLVNQVERDIQCLKKNEVKSKELGEIIIKRLKKVDEVAYIRFASVYHAFKDVKTFERELKKLLRKRRRKRV